MIRLSAAASVLPVAFRDAGTSCRRPAIQDGVQESGSIYRICMPAAGAYNGILVIWAHGFQDAGDAGRDPGRSTVPRRLLYSRPRQRAGIRVCHQQLQQDRARRPAGQERHPRSREVFAAAKGQPQKVYLVGASEGGLITALASSSIPTSSPRALRRAGRSATFRSRSTTSATPARPSTTSSRA